MKGNCHPWATAHHLFQVEYEIDQKGRKIQLGQGAYGKVFAAVCVKTQKKLAVKEVSIQNAEEQLRTKLSFSQTMFNIKSFCLHVHIIYPYIFYYLRIWKKK